MKGSRVRVNVLVTGRVQGVGYRQFARRHALDHGLVGSAENLPDGRVELTLEGESREVDHLLILLRRGPAHADVRSVDVTWGDPVGMEGFHVH